MSNYERIGFHRPPPPESSDDSASDSEGHATGSRMPRSSTDMRRLDRQILEGEEEAEKLLGAKERDAAGFRKIFARNGAPPNQVKLSGRERRRYKKPRGGQKEEESELMYEMEEGHKDSSDLSSRCSDADIDVDVDVLRLKELSTPGRDRPYPRFVRVAVGLLVGLIGLLVALYLASLTYKPKPRSLVDTLSNGTSTFAPTTVLISLDGFRADFLHRNLTPALNGFVQAGVSPEYMLPSFPSVTFPNHFTLVTGLYPESHGVVGNTFWDPVLEEDFYYTDPTRSMQSKWWQAEPIWVTAEKQGVRTAVHMWPGSEAHIGPLEPTYLDEYKGHEALHSKVDRILQLLDLPAQLDAGANPHGYRPQLIAAYVPNVDQDGHLYGPNSTEIRTTISSVDTMLAQLFDGLEHRNLTDIVNIVIVSDHGMATTSTSRLIQLDDIIDMSLIERTDGWPLYGLRLKNDTDIETLYDHLKKEAASMQGFDVYLRDRDMPERYHFSHNERIAPLWVIPHTGWNIVVKEEFDVQEAKKTGQVYHPRGVHGYDHEHPLMRAIFVARGPAFPHTPGSKLEPFQNIDVYNIVCDSVGVVPVPNNGTLRLPLRPVGLHDAVPPHDTAEGMTGDAASGTAAGDTTSAAEASASSTASAEASASSTASAEASTASTPSAEESVSSTPSAEASATSTPSAETKAESAVEPSSVNQAATHTSPPTAESAKPTTASTEGAAPTRPVIQDDKTTEEEDKENVNLWWDWVKGKLDGVKDWASDVYDKVSDKVSSATSKVSDKASSATSKDGD